MKKSTPKKTNTYNQDKEEKIKEIHPYIYELYQHLFETRSKVEERLNFLLAIDTLFLLVFLELFKEHLLMTPLLYIPFVLLIIPILILFINLISKSMWVPWFTKEEVTQYLDENTFYPKSFETIYACASDTYHYKEEKKKIMRSCFIFTYLAVLSLVVLLLIRLDSILSLQISILLVGLIAGVLILIFIFRANDKAYFDHKDSDKIREYFENWLKK